jgi:serine/threonine protein kinase
MRKFFHMVIVLSSITVAGAALYVYLTDKHVIAYNNGTIQTVDDQDVIFLNDGTILYDDSIIEQDEIKYYSKRNIKHLYLDIRNRANKKWYRYESGLNSFFADSNISIGLQVAVPLIILGLILFLLVRLKSRGSVKEIPQDTAEPETKTESAETKDKLSTEEDIVCFFLNLFKCQICAEPGAKVEFVLQKSKSSGPNNIYELRVEQMTDWAKRRMSIGPLGDEAGSKSKCYYVIYDVHMVVKVPARPVTDFELYIESIQKEVAIVNKLVPKECIVPKVSVILNQIHSFHDSENIPADSLEDRYIEWVRRSPEYQNYLKINSTFVYVMDLSQYYFLGHILDELHDIKDLISREIIENADIIMEPARFKGRYGVEKDAIFEVREVYNRVEADIRKLVAKTGIDSNIPIYQFQSWFYSALAQKEVEEDRDKYPSTFVNQLNRLLKETMQEESAVIEIYRKTIKNFVYMSCFERNSAQISAISVNLLDLLAWFRQKWVAMRDLKPDNLFVAGDPDRYPLFLRSDKEFSLGIIDVETAVDFEKSKYTKIKQPLLGGTPFYATPSHFIRNEVLEIEYGNLAEILHLQDWHATLVMIYKVVTGELLFEHTAKLFSKLRDMMIKSNKPENFESGLFEDASRIYWRSALSEFQSKMNEKETSLRAIEAILPQTVKYMFDKVLEKERKSLALAIKKCVESQNIFEKQQIRNQLMNSSHAKTCQFKADLENNARRQQNPNGLRSEAIIFLHQLADLKALLGHHIFMIKRLSDPQATISVYDIMTFMFNVVRNNMHRPQWKPLMVETVNVCDVPDDNAVLEMTV